MGFQSSSVGIEDWLLGRGAFDGGARRVRFEHGLLHWRWGAHWLLTSSIVVECRLFWRNRPHCSRWLRPIVIESRLFWRRACGARCVRFEFRLLLWHCSGRLFGVAFLWHQPRACLFALRLYPFPRTVATGSFNLSWTSPESSSFV